MKLAMVVPRYPPNIQGGGEISCKLLVNSLNKYTDIEVDVISFDKIFPDVQSKAKLNYKSYKYLKNKVGYYDIFHTYNMTLLPSLGYLTKKYNINSVGTFNGRVYSVSLSDFRYKYLSLKYYINKFLLLSYINYIKQKTVLSPYEMEQWVKDGITNMRVVTNMIDDSFKPLRKKNIDDKVRVLFVGNKESSHVNGLEIFLNIFDKLDSNTQLIIVGKGWDSFLREHKTENKVIYKGYISNNEIAKVYSECDIFYHAKFFAPVPIERVTIEAMMSGMCVVSIGNEHYSPIIQHEKSGILIDLKNFNENSILEVFSSLTKEKGKIRNIGKEAKRRVQEVCTPEKIVAEYEKIYRRYEK